MQTILKNWNLFRVLRVALGAFILIQGIFIKDGFSMLMGTVFGGMALLNIGCCGSGGCGIPVNQKNKQNTIEEIEYEEVMDKK